MKKKILTIAAIGAAATLTLAGCSGDGMGGTGGDTGGSESGSGDKGTITLGFLPSWTDGLSTAYLLQDQLEKIGYTVEMKTLTEAGPCIRVSRRVTSTSTRRPGPSSRTPST